MPGPRIVASGPILSITGGHGDLNNYSPQVTVTMFPEKRDFQIADGPEQLRKTIREQVKYGVDVIKISASGGVLSKGDQPGAPQYTLEELKVAAETAHQAGGRLPRMRMGRSRSSGRSRRGSTRSSMRRWWTMRGSRWRRRMGRTS